MSEPSDAERRRGPGRPPQPVNAAGSALDAFGAELRTLRGRRRWTLQALAELTGYSPQHLGAVERARVVPSEAVATACDMALLANGRLVTLLAGVIREQADARNRRQIVRRSRRSADNHGIGAPADAPGTALGKRSIGTGWRTRGIVRPRSRPTLRMTWSRSPTCRDGCTTSGRPRRCSCTSAPISGC
ncbi:MAG: helix-turn-helix domain-containing protein [Pseudonocardia sp.]